MSKVSMLTGILMCTFFLSCNNVDKKYSKTLKGLYVKNAHYNLGEINKKKSTVSQFSFLLENRSNKSICIDTVEVSCNCVAVQEKPKIIKPREAKYLRGQVNLQTETGKISKNIFINFDKNQIMLLRISGKVLSQ